jgi:ATP-dependent exoDNAse (exonuclease V) beta subunit
MSQLDQDLLLEDTANREIALNLTSFIVEAPAGAGKTELLTQRYLKLLDTVDSPEEIIAITFTNKAASEMKKRIMDSLTMANSGVQPPETHKITTFNLGRQALAKSDALGWNLLATPSRLRIYTIDSLSGNLARQMPLLSRFGAQPAVRDDASVYYQEAATKTLANLDEKDHGEVIQKALRYFDNNHSKLNELLADMLAKRDQWQENVLNHNDASLAEAALYQLVMGDMQALATVMTKAVQEALMPIARYAASHLTCDRAVALLRDWETPIPFKPEALDMWRAVAELLLTGSGTFRARLTKTEGFPAGEAGQAFKDMFEKFVGELQQISGADAAITQVRRLPNPKYDAQSSEIVAVFAELLKIASAELWMAFQRNKEVDFVQISQNALSALGGAEDVPSDLALKLDYRIKHLLVDEFQDTSPTQIKLLEKLTAGWMDGDGRTLFLVGDPMQSIYRFRKANVGLFLRALKHGIGDLSLTPLKLWRNNRSHEDVIKWVNDAFLQVFPAQDSVSRGAIKYRRFVPKERPPAGAGVTVHAMLDGSIQSDTDEDLDEGVALTDVRQQEANKIIEIIKATWAENPTRKIAVLVRARRHLQALVAEIRRNHSEIPFQAVEIEELANRQVVQDLLSLTNALHQRADRVHWLAILRAPWCGLSLEDLHHLVGRDQYRTVLDLMHDEVHVNKLSEDGRQRLLHVRDVMQEALHHRGRMATSRWVHGVWLMLGGPACLWDTGDVRDVQAFFERIDKMETAGQFSTEQLAIEVEKLYAAPNAKAPDTLQFMTIHKSKGLEFDTVILPGLDKTTGGGEQPLLMWEEVARESYEDDVADVDLVVAPFIPKSKNKAEQVSIYDYLKSLEKQRADYEDARVLYVAVTRAERCLHLLGAVSPNKDGEFLPKKNTFLEVLWPVVAGKFSKEKLAQIQSEQPKQSASQLNANLQDFVPKLVRLSNPVVPSLMQVEVMHEIQQIQASVPTAKDEEENYLVLEADIGSLTHRYLELIGKQGLGAWSVSRLLPLKLAMQRWFTGLGYSLSAANQGSDAVLALLKTTLQSPHGQWVLQSRESASNELEIESLEDDRSQVRKKIIDRTFIEDGVRWIVDYKTITFKNSLDEANLKQAAQAYRQQLEGYAVLFADEGLSIQLAVYFVSIGRLVTL